jgi:integrase
MPAAKPRAGEPIRVIETQKSPRYRVVLDVAPKGAKRKQHTKTFDTLKEARAHVHETRDRLAKGNYTLPSKVTFEQLATDWLRSRQDIRANSRSGYQGVLNPVIDRLGARAVQSITRPDVDALMLALESEGGRRSKTLSHRTLSYTLTAVQQVFRYGISVGVLTASPAADVRVRRRRKSDRRPRTIWTPEELRAFVRHLDTVEEPWVSAAFRLTACGLRRSEVLGLTWDAISLDAGVVRVEASLVKTGRGYDTERDDAKSAASVRNVPAEMVSPGTVGAMRSLRAAQAAHRLAAGPAYEDADLVVADALGRVIHPEVYSARWRTLTKDAALPPVGLHSVRHTIATMLHAEQVAPAHAAALLGHTVTTHLAYYVVRTEDGLASAATALGGLLQSGG